jgi:hypothetical protein
MADVVIVHAKEKEAVAHRLRDAVAAGGYGAEPVESESPELGGQVDGAAAVILVWSKMTMASEAAGAAAAAARRAGKLVEVSPDGRMPVSAMEDGRAILISGWRGEPSHPGWQKVAAAVERVCGRRKAAVAPVRQAAVAAAPVSSSAAATRPTPPAAARPPAPNRSAAMIAIAAAIVLAVGGAAWLSRSGAPETAEPAPPSVPIAAVAEAPPPEPGPVEPAAEPAASVETGIVQTEPVPVAATEPVRAAAVTAASRPRPAPRPAAARTVQPRAAAQPPQRPVRYRNTRNMRLFCERAGRRTPQCRTFLRSRQGDH